MSAFSKLVRSGCRKQSVTTKFNSKPACLNCSSPDAYLVLQLHLLKSALV